MKIMKEKVLGSIPDCKKVKNLINIKNISEIAVLYAFGSECENWYIKSYQKMKTLDSLQTYMYKYIMYVYVDIIEI